MIITTSSSKASPNLSDKLSGRILLQVEDHGKAWYVSPDNNNQRIHLGSPAEALCLMKVLGLGISNNDLNKYLDNKFPSRLAGKILLAVEQHGEAYYINPLDLKGYYLGAPTDALELMKQLALGITTTNLKTIKVLNSTEILAKCNITIKPEKDDKQENLETEDNINTTNNISLITQEVAPMTNFSHIVSVSATIANPDNITIKEKGLLYDFTTSPNISLNPTIENNNQKIVSEFSSNNNTYTLDITNLSPGSYPFIRAYLITEDDHIIYGNTISISGSNISSLPSLPAPSSSISTPTSPVEPPAPVWTCGDDFNDTRDGNTYNTVAIGGQCWFQENLKYLPMVHSNSEYSASSNEKLPAYGVYGYDGSDVDAAKLEINYSNYGVLYNWYAAMQGMTAEGAQGICPEGWHVPTNDEWTDLTRYVVASSTCDPATGCSPAGNNLKASSTNPISWDGNNNSGFTALPAGGRSSDGDFSLLGNVATLWSSSEFLSGYSWYRFLRSDYSEVYCDDDIQASGFSVRCLKD